MKFTYQQFISLLLFFLLCTTSVTAQEFSYVEQSLSGESYLDYLFIRDTPAVSLKRKCTNDKKTCWSVAVNQSGKKIKSFGSKDSVTQIALGNYRDIGYLLVSHTYSCGNDKTCTDKLLINSNGRIKNIGDIPWDGDVLATRVGRDGELYAVSKDAFITRRQDNNATQISAPESMISAEIGFNVDGIISAIVVAESGQLYWSDGRQWKLLSVTLAAHGDRMEIAAIYPKNRNSHYIALYRYINEYNKGLYTVRFDPVSGKEKGGWLFNSEDRNVGFDPSIYSNQQGDIFVSAKNSSEDKKAFFKLNDSDFLKMNSMLPSHVVENGFQEEKLASFMLGGGISQVVWNASSKLEKNDVIYTEADYLIADTIFMNVNMETRIGDTSIVISYLQNQAEDLVSNEIDAGGNSVSKVLSKEASNYLFSSIDFQGLLSPSSMLRIQAEVGETNGIAKVKHFDGSVAYHDFSTEMKRVAVLAMKEGGYFIGGDYIAYTIPSVIGFSDSSKSIAYSGFDPDFGFQAIRFVTGYDALAYAKRYETDYSRFYWSGSGNIGIGWAEISSAIEDDALAISGENEIDSLPMYFTFGVDLELGYLWQQRFKRFSGLGYSIGAGYRGSFSTMGIGQSDDNDSVSGKLYMEFERDDWMHGAFFKANIIF